MRELLDALFRQQCLAGFPALAGADATARIPVADGLLNQILAGVLPPGGAVRALVLHAQAGDELVADLRIVKGNFGVPFRLVFHIAEQPDLPSRPLLVLRLRTAPLLFSMGGPLIKMLGVLPPGIAVEGDRILLNLASLAARYDTAGVFKHLTELRVTTIDGAVVVVVRGGIAPPEEQAR